MVLPQSISCKWHAHSTQRQCGLPQPTVQQQQRGLCCRHLRPGCPLQQPSLYKLQGCFVIPLAQQLSRLVCRRYRQA